MFQFFSSRFDIIISEIQNSSNVQSTYGGSDYPNAYRTAAGTSKASQQSTQLGAASVCTEPIPVSISANNLSNQMITLYQSFNVLEFTNVSICINDSFRGLPSYLKKEIDIGQE